MSKKLEPCPYCAAEATLESWRTRKGYEASICCTSCLAAVLSIVYDTEEEAVNAVTDNWNRRAATEANEPLTLERFEAICEAVHNGWWEEKINQGVKDHPDMIPYSQLPENVKDYDRVTVRRVLDALGIDCRRPDEMNGRRSPRPPTNADRIRAMSDIELANALQKLCREDICDIVCHGECNAVNTLNKSSKEICKDFIAMWLNKHAKEK